MTEFSLGRPRTLDPTHRTDSFDCGKAPLNEYLRLYALASTQSANARTFVVTDAEQQVVGYYSVVATSIVHEAAPARVKQGQPRHPIPAILMARFAVDLRYQGQGLGRDLFRDALLRSLNITDELGAVPLSWMPKTTRPCATSKFGMMVDTQDPRRLYLLFAALSAFQGR